MTKKLILAMAILTALFACKGKEKAAEQQNGSNTIQQSTMNTQQKEKPTMPEGRLLRVKYLFQGMMMEEFSDFDLRRQTNDTPASLSFKYRGEDVSYEVSDTLFDVARHIIEEERMYEYDSYYTLQMDGRILDGYRWEFDAWFENGKRISTGGRHVSPDGDGLRKISTLLYDAAHQLVDANSQQ